MEHNKTDQPSDASTSFTVDDSRRQNEIPAPPSNSATSVAQVANTGMTNNRDTFSLGAEIIESIQKLVEEMQTLQRDFDTKVKYDESKERQVDSLHRELQTYREGMHFKILRPLFIDLIAIHDDFGKLIESIPNEEPNSATAQLIKNLTSFQETIEEVLRRNGVDAFFAEGTQFVSNKQRVLQTIETTDPSLDKQVAHRVRKGFEYEGRLLRPELVVIYKTTSNK